MTEAEKLKWFLGATEAAAKEATDAFRDAARNGAPNYPHWLFYKPGGQQFAIVVEGHDPPDGFLTAADGAIPATLRSLKQLTAWIRTATQGLPHYPRAN